MKPKEYLKKYALDQSPAVDMAAVLSDLKSDFLGVIEYLQASKQLNETRMQTITKDFETKIFSIKTQAHLQHQSTIQQLQQELFQQTIRPLDEKLFGAARRARAQKKREEEMSFFGFDDFMRHLLLDALLNARVPVPTASFEFLGLAPAASAEDVQNKFRELSKKYHPDLGGSAQDFIRLTEAKNQCLAYASSRK